MTSHLVATYSNGVFVPLESVELPENAKVELTVAPLNGGVPAEPAPGSAEAWTAYLDHCLRSKYEFTRFNREQLYDRV